MTLCHSTGLFLRNSGERDDAADLVSGYLWSSARAQCDCRSADKPNQRNIATHEITRKKLRNSVHDGAHNSGKTSASRIGGRSVTRGAGGPPRHALMDLMRAVAKGDAATALRLLTASPTLASARLEDGATRQAAKACYLDEIEHYLYAGDTALHVAAAAYQGEIARELIAAGADVRARNRDCSGALGRIRTADRGRCTALPRILVDNLSKSGANSGCSCNALSLCIALARST
jgi:hypothetical protein